MKKLYLLRHAHTHPSSVGSDKSRMLTPHGEEQAQHVGEYMNKNAYKPSLVLCSTATRTKQTLNRLTSAHEPISHAETSYMDELYGGTCQQLLQTIRQADDNVQSLMIVAHNPGIYEFAALLCNDKSLESLGFNYSPATLASFDCDIESWSLLEPHDNVLTDITRQK